MILGYSMHTRFNGANDAEIKFGLDNKIELETNNKCKLFVVLEIIFIVI